jgi:hypothetical protein
MERHRAFPGLGERGWWVHLEDASERLKRIVEHDFVVLPRMDGASFDGVFNRGCWFGFTRSTQGCPWVELEVVIESYWFFA